MRAPRSAFASLSRAVSRRPPRSFAVALSLLGGAALAAESLLPLTPAGGPRPTFTDVAAEAGIRFQHRNGSPEKSYIFEAKGGGVCLLDSDGDGRLDIYFVNGSTLEDVRRGVSRPSALYRANGDGTYTDVTERAGVAGRGWGMGCAVGDVDNDGLPDLYVLGLNGNVLYRNTPGGRFEDWTERAGLEGGRWSTSAAFLDHDRDGDLDLYVANNIQVDVRKAPLSFPGPDCNYRGTRVMCGPRGLAGAADAFYRNDGRGTFTDATAAAGLLESPPRYGLGVAVGDFDNDGWPDVYVANDSTLSYLYRNRRDGTFEDVALLAGVAASDDGMEQAGMGTDFGDYDNDGWLDLAKSNFAFENTNLYRNEGDGTFTDRSGSVAAIAVPTYPLVKWGTKFLDYDNDGWKDIVVVNGHVYPYLRRSPAGGETYEQRRLLFRNVGNGRFADVSRTSGPGILDARSSRGLAVGDLDEDGDLDLVVVNMDEVPSVLRNDGGNAGCWLGVRLRGRKSNSFGIGARVTAATPGLKQVAEATTAGSIFSASDSRVHFGLGAASRADLEIRWPSGTVQRLEAVAANRVVVVDEERGIVTTP
ncbi:MAG TPA: CRTAC1 family protein [Vicinamibacteria bacterium]